MGQGGYRPGAGRPKGIKETKPRKAGGGRRPKDATKKAERSPVVAPVPLGADIKKRINDLLASKAVAHVIVLGKQYDEYVKRISQGLKLTAAEDDQMKQIEAELLVYVSAEEPTQESVDAEVFLRTVWNNETIDMALRIRAAEIICRGAEAKKGKKDEKADRAKAAGSGKFAPSAPPVLKVVGK